MSGREAPTIIDEAVEACADVKLTEVRIAGDGYPSGSFKTATEIARDVLALSLPLVLEHIAQRIYSTEASTVDGLRQQTRAVNICRSVAAGFSSSGPEGTES